MSGQALVLRGDARTLPLPDASVDLVCTSPPYFALRSYIDNGQHYAGQIGAEATPAEYIAALVECTRELVRVLKPSGSIWVNLGDKYSGYFNRPGRDHKPVSEDSISHGQWLASQRVRDTDRYVRSAPDAFGIPYKSLMLLPERYRIACVDQLGLIARAVVVWSKPNGLPESVTDRVRRSHEDWVHLVRQPRYFSAVDEIREPHAPGTAMRYAAGYRTPARANGELGLSDRGIFNGQPQTPNALGKLPGSVWEIPTEPLTVPDYLGVDHFTAFPTEWPRRIILGWSPSGICVECGEGRRPVVERTAMRWRESPTIAGRHNGGKRKPASGTMLSPASTAITGEACTCPEPSAPARPAIVLDPFGGTGTTALVAKALGRIGVIVDRSADYCRLAAWRTADPAQLAKAMRVDPPPREHEDQLGLFGREEVIHA